MNKVPTSMNNRQPAGSRDSEWQDSSAPYARTPSGPRVRKVPARLSAPGSYRSPLLSKAVLTSDPDSKPPQA